MAASAGRASRPRRAAQGVSGQVKERMLLAARTGPDPNLRPLLLFPEARVPPTPPPPSPPYHTAAPSRTVLPMQSLSTHQATDWNVQRSSDLAPVRQSAGLTAACARAACVRCTLRTDPRTSRVSMVALLRSALPHSRRCDGRLMLALLFRTRSNTHHVSSICTWRGCGAQAPSACAPPPAVPGDRSDAPGSPRRAGPHCLQDTWA